MSVYSSLAGTGIPVAGVPCAKAPQHVLGVGLGLRSFGQPKPEPYYFVQPKILVDYFPVLCVVLRVKVVDGGPSG